MDLVHKVNFTPFALPHTGKLTPQFSAQPASVTHTCAILLGLFYHLHRADNIEYEGSIWYTL